MSSDFDPYVAQLLEAAPSRAAASVPRRELVAELAMALVLVLAAGAIALLFGSSRHLSLAGAAGLAGLYAVGQHVRFQVGAGTTSPAELVLVPMLLLAPPAAVPLLVAAGLVLFNVPAYLRRETPVSRIPVSIADGLYALGPAVVVAAFAPGPPELRHWPVYVLALGAQFVVDVGASTLREWLANGVPPRLQVSLFGWLVLVDALLAPAGLLAAVAGARNPVAVALVLPTMGLLAVFARERRERIEGALALSHAYRGTAMLMSDVLTARDDYTGGEHSHGVVALALDVGDALGLEGRDRRNLEFAALLHDVGKIHVPDAIINKPGRLTDEEFEVIKRHPADAQEMLERIGGVLADVGVLVRHHHERWDGRGYPDAIAGEAIPLASRIICACDAFSAMTTDRSYRAAMPAGEALAELERCAGSQFDPAVVRAILGVVEREGATPAPIALASAA
ncbi:MAG: HD-GYP domain-containing protein [Solirubrobacteraceae bacterium]